MSDLIRQNALVTIRPNPQSDEPLHLSLRVLGIASNGDVVRASQYTAWLVGSGGTGGYVYTLPDGLPPQLGATFAAGILTGTPTAIGTWTFRATVADSSGTVVTATFAIAVQSRLAITSGAPPAVEMPGAYHYQFSASGATGAVTWSLVDGALPVGLNLSSSGLLSGTPTADGVSYFTVQAADTVSGDHASLHTTLQVYAPLHAVGDEWIPFRAGVAMRATLNQEFAGGMPPYWVEVAADNPDWIAFDDSVMEFFGTPPLDAVGARYTAGVIVTSAGGHSCAVRLNMLIVDPQYQFGEGFEIEYASDGTAMTVHSTAQAIAPSWGALTGQIAENAELAARLDDLQGGIDYTWESLCDSVDILLDCDYELQNTLQAAIDGKASLTDVQASAATLQGSINNLNSTLTNTINGVSASLQNQINAKVNTASLGGAAYYGIGTAGALVPLCNASNTWAARQVFAQAVGMPGTVSQVVRGDGAIVDPATLAAIVNLQNQITTLQQNSGGGGMNDIIHIWTSQTWTAPANGYVRVCLCSGGGGRGNDGPGYNNTNFTGGYGSGGGGASALAIWRWRKINAGQTITFNIAAGGAVNTAGGTSSAAAPWGTMTAAPGASGAISASNTDGNGGAGGVNGAGADYYFPGGNGGRGYDYTDSRNYRCGIVGAGGALNPFNLPVVEVSANGIQGAAPSGAVYTARVPVTLSGGTFDTTIDSCTPPVAPSGWLAAICGSKQSATFSVPLGDHMGIGNGGLLNVRPGRGGGASQNNANGGNGFAILEFSQS